MLNRDFDRSKYEDADNPNNYLYALTELGQLVVLSELDKVLMDDIDYRIGQLEERIKALEGG